MTRPLHSRHCNVIPARPAGRKTYRGSVLPARGLALPDPRLIDRATSAFGFSRRRCRWLFQIGQDRAIGPIVSRAAHHQLLERASHLLHVRDPLPQIFDMAQGDALDVRTAPAAVPPELQQAIDLGDGNPRSRARRTKRSTCTSFSV